MKNRDDLSQLSGAMVAPPEGFRIPESVWQLVREWPTYYHRHGPDGHGNLYYRCAKCDQSIMPLRNSAGDMYRYSNDEIEGQTLAHLIQTHKWTREGP